MAVDVRVLCPVRVDVAGVPVVLPRQARAVLAVLALRAGTPVPPEGLIDALWGDHPPRSARMQVHALISTIRRRLGTAPGGPPPVAGGPAGYLLDLAPEQLDLGRFQHLMRTAGGLRATGRLREAVGCHEAALDEWSGDPCGDLDLPAVRDLVEPLSQQHADALESWAEITLELGDPAAGSRVALRLTPAVRDHPFREHLRALLMAGLATAGRTGEALLTYEECRRRLAEELGVDPSRPLQRLHRDLLAGGAGPGTRPDPVHGAVPA